MTFLSYIFYQILVIKNNIEYKILLLSFLALIILSITADPLRYPSFGIYIFSFLGMSLHSLKLNSMKVR